MSSNILKRIWKNKRWSGKVVGWVTSRCSYRGHTSWNRWECLGPWPTWLAEAARAGEAGPTSVPSTSRRAGDVEYCLYLYIYLLWVDNHFYCFFPCLSLARAQGCPLGRDTVHGHLDRRVGGTGSEHEIGGAIGVEEGCRSRASGSVRGTGYRIPLASSIVSIAV